MKAVSYKIRFTSPYHVGWREPELLIDGSTLLRAVVSLTYSLDSRELIEDMLKCSANISSALPTISCGKEEKILAPFPPLPAMGSMSKLGISWITLNALSKLVRELNACVHDGGSPFLGRADTKRDGEELYIRVECRKHKEKIKLMELKAHGGIAHIEGEQNSCEATEGIFRKVKSFRNRLDRLTAASELYQISGYLPSVPLSVVVIAPERAQKNLEALFKLLSEIGLGGFRSRGWGRFELAERMELPGIKFGFRGPGYYALLSSTPYLNGYADLGKSFITLRYIEGIGGVAHSECQLPFLIAADAGSLVYFNAGLDRCSETIESSSLTKAHLLFNPVLLGE